MTLQPRGSSLVSSRASIVDGFKSPEGKPPPTSIVSILWLYFLPISMHDLARITALLKAEEPCCPDPQWKWMPSSWMPMSLICFILEWIFSSESRSSPNFPEKGVASLSVDSSVMEILQRIFIVGASCRILCSSSIVSAVVRPMPFSSAHFRSFSSLMGFEQTMSEALRPKLSAAIISVLEAQSSPAPAVVSSLRRQLMGLALIAQQGLIQGSLAYQAKSLLVTWVELQTRKLVERGSLRTMFVNSIC